jgi:hypothetical protein
VDATFSSLENKRNALPSGIMDPKRRSGKGGADRVLGHSIVIKIARLAISANVLTKERIIAINRRDSTQDLDLGSE